ncbi:MAG: extensin family protein [Aestuariivirga sp.]
MKLLIRRVATFLLVAMLASCSSGRHAAEFTLDGVQTPPLVCPADPRTFANAVSIPDFQEGNGCGITQGYRVMSLDNIALSEPAQITCAEANSLNSWVASSVQPAAREIYGKPVVAFKVAASYACRARNNVRGEKLSEHGHGNAIDIASFTLADGREISVLAGYYGNGQDQRFLRTIRAQACGIFHTVLGPGSDSYHRNHIHLDMQALRRNGGVYCH